MYLLPLDVVDEISWSIVDPQLTDTFTDRRHVAWIAARKPIDADDNLGFGARISQLAEPIGKLLRLANIDH